MCPCARVCVCFCMCLCVCVCLCACVWSVPERNVGDAVHRIVCYITGCSQPVNGVSEAKIQHVMAANVELTKSMWSDSTGFRSGAHY